jgi:hypothetical protein
MHGGARLWLGAGQVGEHKNWTLAVIPPMYGWPWRPYP